MSDVNSVAPAITANVLGIAEGGEIEAEKFRFCTEASQNEFL
jgi:hypothetical protein